MKNEEIKEVTEEIVEVVEEPVKKTNFFMELVNANSDASSKRFIGMMFAVVFSACSIVAAAGVDLTDNALELIKMEGILGVSLLGLNGIQQVVNTFKK